MTTTTAPRTAARVVDAVKVYGSGDTAVRALDGVSVAFPAGRFTAIMGPSGSGKSTLLSLFGGVLRPSAGKVIVDGQDISRISEADLGRLRSGTVASLLQGASRNLLPYAGAVENVEFARRAVPPSRHIDRRKSASPCRESAPARRAAYRSCRRRPCRNGRLPPRAPPP